MNRDFIRACERGDVHAVTKYISEGIDVNKYYGHGPLHAAAHFGRYKIVRMLLAVGADVNARTAINSTPIAHLLNTPCTNHRAVERTYNILIEAGADPYIADIHGRTAYDKADPAVLEMLNVNTIKPILTV